MSVDKRTWTSECGRVWWLVAARSNDVDTFRMSFSPEMKEAGLSSCFGRLDVKESRCVYS